MKEKQRKMVAPLDKNTNNLPIIKPKINSSNEERIMSKIHILKNWKLPPSPSYVASGRKRKNSSDKTTSVSENEELLLKKQRQNRDAQRTYRERKEMKLKEMESMINALQDQVKHWKKLYHSKCNEMSDLEKKYNQAMQERHNITQSTQSDLCSLINNFKPLKPVPLLTSTNKTFKKTTSPLSSSTSNMIDKDLIPLRPLHKFSKSTSIVQTEYNQARRIYKQTKSNSNNNDTFSTSCGFCDGSSSCICDELTSTTTQKNPKAIISTVDMTSSPALSKISGPMTIAQLTCSSDPHNCTKCADINETCIKPSIGYGNNNNDDNNTISNEIDFTNYKQSI